MVCQPVPIAVYGVWIGRKSIFLDVLERISILVIHCIIQIWICAIQQIPVVGHPVIIGVGAVGSRSMEIYLVAIGYPIVIAIGIQRIKSEGQNFDAVQNTIAIGIGKIVAGAVDQVFAGIGKAVAIRINIRIGRRLGGIRVPRIR